MRVQVKLFAAARQRIESDQIELELVQGATIAELRKQLCQEYPSLRPLVASAMFAVNQSYATDDTVLIATSEIACIPPVSGG